MKPKYDYIDYCKCLGIICVIMSHIMQYFPGMSMSLTEWLCSFNVPIFFTIAGTLSFYNPHSENFGTFFRRRAKALLVPYLWFSFFNSLIKLGVLFLKHQITTEVLRTEFWDFSVRGNGSVWFLSTLFGVELLYFCYKKLPISNEKVKSILFTLLSLTSIFVVSLLPTNGNPFLQLLFRIFESIGFYGLGYAIPKIIQFLKTKIATFILGSILIISALIIYLKTSCNIWLMGAYFSHYTESILVCLFNCLGFILILYSIRLPELIHRFAVYYGRNSLAIMVIHPFILLCFTYPLGNFFETLTEIQGFAVGMSIWAVTVALEPPFVFVLTKYFPFFLGKSRKKISS